MKLIQQLLESIEDEDRVLAYLKTHCSEYLKLLKANPNAIVYRGMSNPEKIRGVNLMSKSQEDKEYYIENAAIEIDTPSNRQPLSNIEYIQTLLPYVINTVTGVPKDYRKRSIFGSTDEGQTKQYGLYSYVLIPHDGWECTGFNNVSDSIKILKIEPDIGKSIFNMYFDIYEKHQNADFSKLLNLYVITPIGSIISRIFEDEFDVKYTLQSVFAKEDLLQDEFNIPHDIKSADDIVPNIISFLERVTGKLCDTVRQEIIMNNNDLSKTHFFKKYLNHNAYEYKKLIKKYSEKELVEAIFNILDKIEECIRADIPRIQRSLDANIEKLQKNIITKDNFISIFSSNKDVNVEIAFYGMKKAVIIRPNMFKRITSKL